VYLTLASGLVGSVTMHWSVLRKLIQHQFFTGSTYSLVQRLCCRSKHSAPSMTLARDLCEYSQRWADDIAKRDKMEHSKCTLPSGGRVGENIYMCWSSDPSAGIEGKCLILMDSSTNLKLLPKRRFFFDLVISFITNRKYAFFCIF